MKSKNRSYSLKIKGTLREINTPWIMGILNLTPDSFYTGSRRTDLSDVLRRVETMLKEGADILDLGGQSTRPGAERISVEEELGRVIAPVEEISKRFPDAIISIDTFYSAVAGEAIQAGAAMINDVSAGSLDPGMWEKVAQLNVPYVLMHMQGEPQIMQQSPQYEDVVGEITHFFSQKLNELRAMGIHDVILDPGFGFGKTIDHNMQLLNRLDSLNMFGLPVLAGLSRKKTIQRLLDVDVEGALNGTTAMNTIALMNGAALLRVHDVKEAKEAVKIYSALINSSSSS